MTKSTRSPDKLFQAVRPRSEGQKRLWSALNDPEIQYIAVTGEAGVGKTFLSCYYAMKQYIEGRYNKIYIARSVLPIRGESIGYLKGDAESKLEGYMVPMIENFEKFMPDSNTIRKAVELVPLVQIRGRSIENSIFLCDEGQNLSLDVLRACVTRLNEKSKVVFMGDIKQNDTHKKVTDFERFCRALDGMNAFEWVQLTEADQQRNRNISEINRRLDRLEEDEWDYDNFPR